MERSNVETVIVAGKVRKWKGRLLDVDLRSCAGELESSRDYIFATAGIPQTCSGPPEVTRYDMDLRAALAARSRFG